VKFSDAELAELVEISIFSMYTYFGEKITKIANIFGQKNKKHTHMMDASKRLKKCKKGLNVRSLSWGIT